MSTWELDRLLGPSFGIEAAEEVLLEIGGGANRDGRATGFELSIDSRLAICSLLPPGPFIDKRSPMPGSLGATGGAVGT
jgi:hypothetical protein